MIRRSPLLESFERSYLEQHSDIAQKLMQVESLYNEARALGVLPLKNPLEGLEVDIARSRVFNGLRKDPGRSVTRS